MNSARLFRAAPNLYPRILFSTSHRARLKLRGETLTESLAMSQTRASSTKGGPEKAGEHADGHTHPHSILHSHAHDDHDHVHGGAEQIVHVLEGKGDRGSRVTLLGLVVNVGVTGAKGLAGWYMHSASLLADAGHSLSDLLGDLVTLFCWKLSRRPPSERYPYGFAKFETLGTTTVSVLLIGGALGIGFHSCHLLMDVLAETVTTLPPGQLHDVLQQVASVGRHVPSVGHAHAHVGVLDPNAAWFAAMSVLCKEWLYRITKKVADEEHSPVLYANAVHHRSDAYSSIVALFAILGSSVFPALPLDPLGGLLVSIVILRQGVELLGGAFAELMDAGISARSRDKLVRALDPLVRGGRVLAVEALRAKRAGSLTTVDVTVRVPHTLTASALSELEDEMVRSLKDAKGGGVSEVRASQLELRFSPSTELDAGAFRLIELPPELCQLIDGAKTSEPVFTIKGHPTEDAVACTADRTYALRSVVLSNTVLVLTPSRTDPDRTVHVREQLHEILELVPSVPRLHTLSTLLSGMEYDDGEEDRKRPGYSYEQARTEIQASDGELKRGLEARRILVLDGDLRPIAPAHLDTILELLLNYLVSLNASHEAAPVDDLVSALADDHDVPREVSSQIMAWFGRVDGDAWKMDVDAVVREIGLGVLRHYKHEHILETELMARWKNKVGDAFESVASSRLLSGNYVATTGSTGTALRYFPASMLPTDPAARFAELFLTRARWRSDEIEPFLSDLAVNTKERDKLLLKYARAITTPEGAVYTARAGLNN